MYLAMLLLVSIMLYIIYWWKIADKFIITISYILFYLCLYDMHLLAIFAVQLVFMLLWSWFPYHFCYFKYYSVIFIFYRKEWFFFSVCIKDLSTYQIFLIKISCYSNDIKHTSKCICTCICIFIQQYFFPLYIWQPHLKQW